MKNVFKFFALSALLACFALFAGSAFAQTTTTGSIEGTVTDPTGAAVAGVTVTATRQGGRSATATTNDEGFFRPGFERRSTVALDLTSYVTPVCVENRNRAEYVPRTETKRGGEM